MTVLARVNYQQSLAYIADKCVKVVLGGLHVHVHEGVAFIYMYMYLYIHIFLKGGRLREILSKYVGVGLH